MEIHGKRKRLYYCLLWSCRSELEVLTYFTRGEGKFVGMSGKKRFFSFTLIRAIGVSRRVFALCEDLG